jgi:DnaJ-class molecular chaperone
MLKSPEKMWEELLGSPNIKTEQFSPDGDDMAGSMFGSSLGGSHEPRPTKLDDIEITLNCSLEEFYEGSLRSVEFQRNETDHNPKVAILKTRSRHVQINPGFSDKTVLVFKGEGH